MKVSGSDYSSLGTLIVGTGAKLDIGTSALIFDYTETNTPMPTKTLVSNPVGGSSQTAMNADPTRAALKSTS